MTVGRSIMPVEFIGMLGTNGLSESRRSRGPAIDKAYLASIVQAHEYAGFDRALIGYFSYGADGFQVATYAAAQTRRLKLLLAHRPGFVAPALAARQLASLDQFSDGRLAVHIITGGDDDDQQREGDFLSKDERYARTDEYLDIVKKVWTLEEPFDHAGAHYRLRGAFTPIKPLQKPRPLVYFGGSSEAAIRVAGKHADVYAFWGEPLAQVRETVSAVRSAAATYARPFCPRFSLSLRPILGATEAEAWARADRILQAARVLQIESPVYAPRAAPQNVGSQRLLHAASQGKIVDKRLWTEIAALTGAKGNSTSLVGTPEQVAEALLEYYEAGITTFLIRGFDPIEDALQYGRDLIPLVRAEIERRETGLPATEAVAS
jgi:alkanesulfonate monooxygenase